MTLLDWLIKQYPNAARQTLRRMVESRRVFVNETPARSVSIEITSRDKVIVRDRTKPVHNVEPDFEIIFEDEDVLVIDKPPGLLTATVAREKRPTALAMVQKYLPGAQIGLIHRLDRDASGLLVFSKNPGAYHSLKEQFFRHTVDRIYHAIVDGVPTTQSGKIKSKLIERNDGSVHSSTSGQPAITEYQLLRTAGQRSLLRVKLFTGRKHQIRAHLSERGWPIVNDAIYSDAKRAGRLMLAATELAFDHPRTNKRVKFTIALPPELRAMIR